jgi:hypothetical protein
MNEETNGTPQEATPQEETNGTPQVAAVEAPVSASYTEAPASFTVKCISPAGFDCLLTIRDETAAGLMPRVLASLEWLQARGFTPPYFPKHNGSAPAGGNGGGDANAPTCQYHGKMKRSTKFAGWYCPSKMGDGSYCKEQVKDS